MGGAADCDRSRLGWRDADALDHTAPTRRTTCRVEIVHGNIFAFTRGQGEDALLVAMNLSPIPAGASVLIPGADGAPVRAATIELEGREVLTLLRAL